MHATRLSENVPADVLVPMKTRWAVLAALLTDLVERGVSLPQGLRRELAVTRMALCSGGCSPGEPQLRLARLEGKLVTIGFAMGDHYLDGWLDLLRQAACGEITEDDLRNIPRPTPVAAEGPVPQIPLSAAA